jgi:hypothetical protein
MPFQSQNLIHLEVYITDRINQNNWINEWIDFHYNISIGHGITNISNKTILFRSYVQSSS